MVMEQRRSLFGRLFARLWRNQDNYSCSNPDTTGQARARSNSTPVFESPAHYSRRIRDPVLPRFCILPTTTAHYAQSVQTDTHENEERNVVNQTFRLRFSRQNNDYVPKCLAEVDCQALLTGQTTYDDFSENCWLENHLHRFGGVQVDPVQVCDSPESYSDSDASIPPYPSPLPPLPPTINDNTNNDSLQPEVDCGNTSTISSNSRSTVSDVTQFYNSMGLLGPSFLEDDLALDPPPPYSEIPDDPPPPYTYASRISERAYASRISERAPASTLSGRASTQFLSLAILW